MAIGNQLDLNIVVNGFNQAQSALDRLSGVFGNLGQNAVNVSSTFKNLQLSLERSQSEITGVSNTTNKATKSISDFGESLTAVEGGGNRAGESIRDIAQIVQQAEQAVVALRISLAQTASTLGQFAFQIGSNLVGELRNSAIEMEQLEIQLKTIGRASEDTTKSLERLVKISRLPGLDFQQAVRGVTQLRATGVSAELAEEAISNLGNALASVGADPSELSGVVRAFSQIQSKGKVYAEEIYQIAERLPQIRTIMLETIGTADTELLAKEGYSANQFLQLVTDGLSQLPRVADNTRNELSNLKNEIFLMTASLGKELLPTIKKLTKFLSDVVGWIDSWSTSTKNMVAQGAIIVAGIGAIVSVLGSLGILLIGVNQTLSLFGMNLNASAIASAGMGTATNNLNVAQSQAIATTAGQTLAMKGLETQAKATGVAVGLTSKILKTIPWVFVIGTIGLAISSFLKFRNQVKKTKTDYEDLKDSIQDTNEKMSKFQEINRLTQDIKMQAGALVTLKDSYKDATEALKEHQNAQKGTGTTPTTTTTTTEKELKTKDEQLAQGVKDSENRRNFAQNKLEEMQRQMISLINNLDIRGLSSSFVGFDAKSQLTKLKYKTKEGKEVFVNELEDYNKWIEQFRTSFYDSMKKDLDKYTNEFDKLTESTTKEQSAHKTKSYNLKFLVDSSMGLDVYKTMREILFDKVGEEIEVAQNDHTKTTLETLNELGNLKDTTEITKQRAGYDPSKIVTSTNKALQLHYQVIKKVSDGNNEEIMNQALDQANIYTRTFHLIADSSGTLNEVREKMRKYLDAEDVDKESDVYKRIQVEYEKIANEVDVPQKRFATQGAELSDLYQKIQSLKKAITSVVTSKKPLLVTSKITEFQSLIEEDMRNSQVALTEALEESRKTGANVDSILSAYQNVMKVHKPIDLTANTNQDMIDVIKTFDQTYNAELEQRRKRLDILQNLATKGFNSAVKVLIDQFGVGGKNENQEGVLWLSKVIEKAFMENGKFSTDMADKLNEEIQSSIWANRIHKLETDMDVDLEIYDRVRNPAELFNLVKEFISLSTEGSQDLLTNIQSVVQAEDANIERVKEEIGVRYQRRSDTRRLFKLELGLLQDGYAKNIGLALIEHDETIAEYQEKIELYTKDSKETMLGDIEHAKELIKLEDEVFSNRFNNIVEEERLRRKAEGDKKKNLESKVVGLREQESLVDAVDPEAIKLSKQQLQYETTRNKLITERNILESEYSSKVRSLEDMKEADTLLHAKIVRLMKDERSYAEEIFKIQNKMKNLDENEEEWLILKKELKNLIYYSTLAERDSKKSIINLNIQALDLENRITMAIASRTREQTEQENSLKRTTSLAKSRLEIELQGLKNNNRDNSKKLEIIKKEFEIKKQQQQFDYRTALNEKERLEGLKKSQNDRLTALKELESKGKFGEDGFEFKTKADLKKAIDLQQILVDTKISETEAWKENANEIAKSILLAQLLNLQQAGAETSEYYRQQKEDLDDLNSALETQLTNQKRIRAEISAQQSFQKDFGISADVFGFNNWDESKWNSIKDGFKNFFQEGVDPSTIEELHNLTDEYKVLKDKKKAINVAEFEDEKEAKKLIDDITQQQLDLYRRFNDNYRKYLNDLKNMSQERFNNAKSHAEEMLGLTQEGALLDLENEYAGRNMTPSLESEKLQKELDLKAKFIQDQYDLDNKALEQRKGRLGFERDAETGNYKNLTEEQKSWLRDKQSLNQKTNNSYKQLENIAKSHNFRFSANATKADKFNNKLGSQVLKYLDEREKRTAKHHATLEDREKKHQREMQKFLDQDGQTLKDKADKYAQAQFKYAEEIDKINQKHNSAQIKSRENLEKALRSSHTGKGGMPVELEALMTDMKDIDEAEKLGLPKTKADYMKLMRDMEIKDEIGVSKWGAKIGKFFKRGDYEKKDGKWFKKVEEYAKYMDTYEDGRWSVTPEIDKLFKELKSMEKFEEIFKGADKNKLDHTKIAETLATFAEMKMNPGAISEFMTGIDNFKEIEEKLQEKAKEAEMTPLEQATKKATDNMNNFAGQLLMLSGENGNLSRFGQAIDSVTFKLNNLAMQMGSAPSTSNEVINTTPQVITVENNLNIQNDSNAIVRNIQSGVTGANESVSSDPFNSFGLSGGTGWGNWKDPSANASKKRFTKDRPSTMKPGGRERPGALVWEDIKKNHLNNKGM